MHRQPRADDRRCPACDHDLLWVAGGDEYRRFVCDRCGSCHDEDTEQQIDSIACDGCPVRPVCQSRPTAAALARHRPVVLGDGTRIGIRVLVPGDRDALAEAYEALSERSRRLRFFSPPKHLSPALLDYLTTLDYRDQFALVAFVEEDQEGIGLARWTRDRDHPTEAEAAVVVLDDWQHRGVGSALLTALIDEAVAAGIEVFTADVLWENRIILDPVRALGARIGPLEPGVARVEFDLPADDSALATSAVRRFLRDVAAA